MCHPGQYSGDKAYDCAVQDKRWPNLQTGQLEYTIYTCVLDASDDQRFGRRVAYA